jgi:hypothetical protein
MLPCIHREKYTYILKFLRLLIKVHMQFIDRHADAMAVQWRIAVRVSISLVTYIDISAFLNSGWHKVQLSFRKLKGVVGTGWSWLRIGTGGGHLWVR